MLNLTRVVLSLLFVRKISRPKHKHGLSLITSTMSFLPQNLSLQCLCVFKFSKMKIVIEIWKPKTVLPEYNAQMFLFYLFWKFDSVWVLCRLRSVLTCTFRNDNTENTFWFHLLWLMGGLTNKNSKYKVQSYVKWWAVKWRQENGYDCASSVLW